MRRLLVILFSTASACSASSLPVPPISGAPTAPAPTLTPPGLLAVAVAHTCARTIDGKLWCWGFADEGELATADDATRLRPIEIHGLPPIAGVAAGNHATCAWTAAGAVWCWGTAYPDGDAGGLRVMPRQVPKLAGVATVDLEGDLACARRTNGTVVCWTHASFADPETTLVELPGVDEADEVTVGSRSVCVRVGPSVRCTTVDDASDEDEPVEDLEDVAPAHGAISIAIGVENDDQGRLFALFSDGRIVTIGLPWLDLEPTRRAPPGACESMPPAKTYASSRTTCRATR